MPMALGVEVCKLGQQFGDPQGHDLVLASAFLACGKAIPDVCIQLALSTRGCASIILCEVRARMRAAQRAQRAQPLSPDPQPATVVAFASPRVCSRVPRRTPWRWRPGA